MSNVIFIVFGVIFNSFTEVPFFIWMNAKFSLKSCKTRNQIFKINILSLVEEPQKFRYCLKPSRMCHLQKKGHLN